MKRTNTVTWSDGCVLTRLMGQLQDELMKYQMYTHPDKPLGQGKFDGDASVIGAAIYLRNKLISIIDKSSEANKR